MKGSFVYSFMRAHLFRINNIAVCCCGRRWSSGLSQFFEKWPVKMAWNDISSNWIESDVFDYHDIYEHWLHLIMCNDHYFTTFVCCFYVLYLFFVVVFNYQQSLFTISLSAIYFSTDQASFIHVWVCVCEWCNLFSSFYARQSRIAFQLIFTNRQMHTLVVHSKCCCQHSVLFEHVLWHFLSFVLCTCAWVYAYVENNK